jgi:hypothetical protein
MNSLPILAKRAALVMARKASPSLATQSHRATQLWFSTAPKQTFAVDAPDGTSDALLKEELHEVENIIDFAAAHEDADAVNKLHAALEDAKKIIGVEAPDGTSDALLKGEEKEVEEIINFAATHEDKDKINKIHELMDAVKKERVRDPEHDW